MARTFRSATGPDERLTIDQSVRMALLVVLETMTPAQRVAFVLHYVLKYPQRRFGADMRTAIAYLLHFAPPVPRMTSMASG